MAVLNVTPPFIPQEYTPLYVQVGGKYLTEVQSLTLNRMDGGAPVETRMRGWAGRVMGAPKSEATLKGVIPYFPTDDSGQGFDTGGMTSNTGLQLDETMLTAYNLTQGQPIQFIFQVGSPAAQQAIFLGYITSINVDAAIGKQSDFTVTAEGQFAIFQDV